MQRMKNYGCTAIMANKRRAATLHGETEHEPNGLICDLRQEKGNVIIGYFHNKKPHHI